MTNRTKIPLKEVGKTAPESHSHDRCMDSAERGICRPQSMRLLLGVELMVAIEGITFGQCWLSALEPVGRIMPSQERT